LLDTHAFLWAILDAPQFGAQARAAFVEPSNEIFLSYVSVWEAVIKAGAGKLALPRPASAFLAAEAARNRVTLLPVALGHLAKLETLPPNHRDPFDRLLVAQALDEGWPLVSADSRLAAYGVTLIW
jgi:PIN domain nuclease of toxin-antitoxin system